MKDLEIIVLDIIDDRVRPLAQEALRAYQAGAMRSAVVSLWIAVLMDLTLKLRHLAEGGEVTAVKALERLDRALDANDVAGVQRYERELLNLVASQLQMLTPRERVEIERLYADRNLCAHPAFASEHELFTPTPELVRSHFRAAGTAVFAQPPTAGKRLVALLQTELAERSWPTAKSGALKGYLQQRYFARTRDSAKRQVVQLLVKCALRVDPATIDLRTARNAREAIREIADLEPALLERELADVLSKREHAGALTDEELARSCGAFGFLTSYEAVLPTTALTRLETMLPKVSLEVLIDSRFFSGGRPASQRLAKAFDQAVRDLEFEQLKTVLESASSCAPFVERALELVSESNTYRGAEARLRLLERCAPELQPQHVKRLGEIIQSNRYDQIGKAGATPSILVSMLESGPRDQSSLLEWQTLVDAVEDPSIVDPEDLRYAILSDAIRNSSTP